MDPTDSNTPHDPDTPNLHPLAREAMRRAARRLGEELVVSPAETRQSADRLMSAMGHEGWRSRDFASPRPVTRPKIMGRWTKRATWHAALTTVAGAILGVVVVLIGWHLGPSRFGKAPAALTYRTANGQRANITLPDGNTVTLNVASRLEVPADYASGNHTVRLTGEALFNVQHHDANPLTIVTDVVSARVLGTQFVVRHYTGDTAATVAVRNGKVSVTAPAVAPIVVPANRQVTIAPAHGTFALGVMNPTEFGFGDGVLTIDGGTLRDALPQLSRWYDVDVRLGDSTVAKREIAGSFKAGSPSDLAEILQGTLGIRVVRDGRTLNVFSR